MFGISDSEWLVILFILIVVVGPRRFPEIAREFSKFYKAFIKAYEQAKKDIKQNIDLDSEYLEDIKKIRELKNVTNLKEIKEIKNLNPIDNIKKEWKDLIEQTKNNQDSQTIKEQKPNEEKKPQ